MDKKKKDIISTTLYLKELQKEKKIMKQREGISSRLHAEHRPQRGAQYHNPDIIT